VTIFLGCGFAAKYREGGGNFSVPLQWMLGLRRLKLDAIWLEHLPATKDRDADEACIRNFQRQLREHGLSGCYCLLYQTPASSEHDLGAMRYFGLTRRELLDRLGGPNTILNLSYSCHPPFLLEFERRIFCDLDPSEIFYWMTKMELGQSSHHEFWTIGLNVHGRDCRLPTVAASLGEAQTRPREMLASSAPPAGRRLPWKTFYPLVDTHLYRPTPPPVLSKFTTIGQWYWSGAVEVNGEYPDLSKRFAFERYIDLPRRVPAAQFELAMNINADDPERTRLARHGWQVTDPHKVARTPRAYRRYIASATAEFTAVKGVDVSWKTGWVSDRAAAFLACGRPVVTEDTGAASYLPRESGFFFVHDANEAEAALRETLTNWRKLSKAARRCAVEIFEATTNLRRILSI
jgi:hypothetical protein